MHWHDYLAFSLFAVASGYVAFCAYRALFAARTNGCAAACGSCRQNDAGVSQGEKLLSIDAPPRES
jgi:hypothetical protein